MSVSLTPGFEAVKHPDVFVVQVDVDEAVELTFAREELVLRFGVLGDERVQHLAHVRTGNVD